MQPFTVLLGILLGSIFSIAFSLGIVVLIFFLHGREEPRLVRELPALLEATGSFALLSVVAAFAFLGFLRSRPWRWWPALLLFVGLFALGWRYWPE